MTTLRRRTFLIAAAVTGATVVLPPTTPAGAETNLWDGALKRREPNQNGVLTGAPSHNGWEMEAVADGRGNIHTRPVPGTPLSGVQLRVGVVDAVLAYVIHRFHCDVDELRDGDVVGWRPPATVTPALAESNRASGTAVKIRPGHYPAGSRGGFYPPQVVAIRAIIADLGGVVRWGGDDKRVDEALFSIDVGPDDRALPRTALRVRPL
ncbi:M15 family peptidase [Amycolatopsis eburnea]|uniref:M15 family peptidase n=1 Tax=Amycolatopsis eburnea TaxID=2267691 RepID=UPI001CDD716A|nr:M15 family peptidase [Amycolatopsis eburnea]